MLRITGWRRLSLAAPVILALAVPACSPAAPAQHVSVTATPGQSSSVQAVHIKVTGLAAGQQATMQVTSTDAHGVAWVSADAYRAGAGGVIDPDQDAPVSGDYRGVSGMGPVWSMHEAGPAANSAAEEPAYYWSTTRSLTFTVTLRVNGARVASTSFQRRYSAVPLREEQESLASDGFAGYLMQPASGPRRRAAVLLLGGSEGGLPDSLTAGLLAGQGYTVLGVGYFKLPGLPSTLSDIPLEYFARALRWLARQPGVDPAKIAVLGVSRGSEAAQLLGVHYPSLVHAVIATVPSNAALCSYPGCRTAAWTLGGKPLPYTSEVDNPVPIDDRAAVIPDQRIDGPVFLDCGEADQIWTSCPYARAILSLLDGYRDRWTHVLYAYPGAGHAVGEFSPYEPLGPAGLSDAAPSVAAFQKAEPALVQHLFAFLAAFSAS